MKQVTTVIVNYQTPDLLRNAVLSFKEHYPETQILIFDNGSKDDSKTVVAKIQNQYPDSIHTHFEEENIFHGPALDKSITELVKTEFCFFLDSDTVTKKKGFLEKGVDILSMSKKNYALGYKLKANKRGFKDPEGIPIILTPYLLMKTEPYQKFPPFFHHGQPVLHNFREAQNNGYELIHFPMEEYIDHLWRGTASKFGYGLGLKGKFDYVLNKLGI
ncbi:glycosyltransferase family 2 protein [Rhodohalobacter sp. 8-1]|uniref:glycosyltransferase family 2 protein n=1 Tax=Rhodohalobacter sp. 8-1 TaxID=3131972 RepID=UPI0030EC9C17